MKKRWQNGLALLPLLLLAIPLLLQPAAEDRLTRDGAETLVVLTPHSESIRYEFERAFQKYYREHYGRDIVIDWRSPGGSSDIVRYIDDRYEAAFREYFLSDPANGGWDEEIAVNYANHRLNPATASPRAVKARELFLNSDVGIGVDLFFGGGMYDQQKHAARGFAVDGGVARRHPDIFRPEVIPASFSGETLFDLQGRTYGVCLSSFGICSNPDRLAELGGTPPHSWSDLGEGKFFRTLSVADPTKSGSITKCFEMILQQNMQQAQKSDPEHGVADGWANGMNLIKRIAGNAVTITDSAGKVTRDVASGNAAAGMCIDFYAFAEAEWTAGQNNGISRIVYVLPESGSSITADPVQLLRGAPNRPAAEAFLDFLLSLDGQKLWDFKVGTPGGPVKYVIRRPPIRRDLYVGEFKPFLADGDYNPYEGGGAFEYDGRLTGAYFNLIRVLIKCVVLDPLDELQAAWQAILEAGGPEAVPEAMAQFNWLPFAYEEAGRLDELLYPQQNWSMAQVVALRREWTKQAQQHYLRAAELARQGK